MSTSKWLLVGVVFAALAAWGCSRGRARSANTATAEREELVESPGAQDTHKAIDEEFAASGDVPAPATADEDATAESVGAATAAEGTEKAAEQDAGSAPVHAASTENAAEDDAGSDAGL